MSLHRNRVQMTVTGTPGTGTITLNAATSGYQSFASAYGADATVDILITEGNNWEVCRNCAYTNGTPQVDRGTLEASSTGSAVSFTSSAVVSVIATAASGNNWGLNEIQASPTGAGVTGVVGTLHLLNISGLTADRDFTLPATCAVGDRVGVFITTGDDAFELLLKPASGDTINGGSPAAEWSRLFITGECVIFRCITANQDWIVEYDGRRQSFVRIDTNGTTQSMTRSVSTKIDAALTTVTVDTASQWDSTNKRFVPRRAGKYIIHGHWQIANQTASNACVAQIFKNNTTNIGGGGTATSTGSGFPEADVVLIVEATVGDYYDLRGFFTDATNPTRNTNNVNVYFEATSLP